MEPEFESIKEIEEYLKNLSNEDISDRLKAFNCKSGPVTKSTRILYLKRLKEIFVSSLKFLDDIEPSYEKVKNNYEQKNDNEEQKNHKKTEFKHSIIKPPKIVTYFGVQVPSFHNKEGPFVFADKLEAVKFSKTYPGSRFKMFVDEEEARKFSAEVNFSAVAFTKMRDGQRADDSDLVVPLFPTSATPKESLPFSSIKCSEFVMFRKALEIGDVERAKELIWSNPRYLIGNGDNPTVLQEGCRYNALHVCAKNNQLESCHLVMDTITDLNFYLMLYRDELPEKRQARLDFLVDMYLNNREKGGMETPLHFACKFGFEDIVKYLLKFGVIDRNAKNSAGQTPSEIINSRAKESNLVVKKRIENAFEDPYYIFIIRSEDNSELPQVSHPFCPNRPTISALVPTNLKSRSFRKFFSSPTRLVHANGINSRTKSCVPSSDHPKENGSPKKRMGSIPCRIHPERTSDKDNQSTDSNVGSLAEFRKQCTEINRRWLESRSANGIVDEKLKEEEVSNHSQDTISQGDACSSDGDCKSSNLCKLSHQGDCGTSTLSSKTFKDLETSSSSSSNDSKSHTPHQNGITNHAFDCFETPPRNSTRLPSTPSDLKNCFQTPRNLVNGKVSILCKTPTNKQLILLADAGLENSLSPYALAKGERFSTPEPMKPPNSKPTPSKSACKDTDNWEKILNTPIFTAKDIPKKIRGIAGPMAKNKCCDFREKVLLRDLDDEEYDDFNRIRRTDSNKGLERICRQIAKCMDVSWSEYWDFLGCDTDLTSEEGLDLFEGHMKGIVEFSVSVCENINVEKETGKTEADDQLSNDFSRLCIKSPPVKVNKRLRWSDESREDDDDDEFLDARTKLDDGEEFYELNSRYNNGMFIFGDLPTRSDLDAFRAVEPLGKHLKAYPFVYSWFTNIKSFSEAERSRWPDAASIGHVLSTGQSRRRDLFASIRKYDLVSSPSVARDLTPRFLEG